ncbi:hypothetical protein NC653_026658 [Populus alba x Populus x berolinensis]|uniref:Uncharacterized protein n=1 Tax=Populus alba x Populus x berolinensis TaxID=444605 RepID=A0AAD6QAJ8_9ROSI|nr:hypothetical protein NC653_026658 [Populus alba x Populus x berolinensis]
MTQEACWREMAREKWPLLRDFASNDTDIVAPCHLLCCSVKAIDVGVAAWVAQATECSVFLRWRNCKFVIPETFIFLNTPILLRYRGISRCSVASVPWVHPLFLKPMYMVGGFSLDHWFVGLRVITWPLAKKACDES